MQPALRSTTLRSIATNRSVVFITLTSVTALYVYRRWTTTRLATRAVSRRAHDFLQSCVKREYITEHINHLSDTYHPTTRPDGYLNLAIAENKVTFGGELLKKARTFDLSLEHVGYDDNRGCHTFRQAVAQFMAQHTEGVPLDPDHVCAAAGCSAATDLLFYALCDEGDGVIVPAPYYTGFRADLDRARLHLVPAADHSIEAFEAARRGAARRGIAVRALMTSSPHNPSGRLVTQPEIATWQEWAAAHGLHLILDEVYANSVHGGDGDGRRRFVSGAGLAARGAANVHVIYGFAKDFGMAGARVGVLYTADARVREVFCQLAHGCEASLVVQGLCTHLLTCPAGGRAPAEHPMAGHLRAHARDLKSLYSAVLAALDAHNLPAPVPAQAGLFILMDWRVFVDRLMQTTEETSDAFTAEHRLWRLVLDEAKVNLTPGQVMGFTEAGWFRLCFGGYRQEVLRLAVQRIAECFERNGLLHKFNFA